jgi:hypothetical protein
MARKRTRRNSDPPDSSWIDKLAFDPAEYPDARAIVGYLRKSPDSRSLQLYTNLDLHDYLEIQPKDILDQKRYAGSEGLPRTVVWLKGSAVVREVHVSTIEDQARFLSGRISDRHLQPIAARSYAAISPDVRTTTINTAESVCVKCWDV